MRDRPSPHPDPGFRTPRHSRSPRRGDSIPVKFRRSGSRSSRFGHQYSLSGTPLRATERSAGRPSRIPAVSKAMTGMVRLSTAVVSFGTKVMPNVTAEGRRCIFQLPRPWVARSDAGSEPPDCVPSPSWACGGPGAPFPWDRGHPCPRGGWAVLRARGLEARAPRKSRPNMSFVRNQDDPCAVRALRLLWNPGGIARIPPPDAQDLS